MFPVDVEDMASPSMLIQHQDARLVGIGREILDSLSTPLPLNTAKLNPKVTAGGTSKGSTSYLALVGEQHNHPSLEVSNRAQADEIAWASRYSMHAGGQNSWRQRPNAPSYDRRCFPEAFLDFLSKINPDDNQGTCFADSFVPPERTSV